MQIKRLDYNFTVCKVKDFSEINLEQEFCFSGKTDEEHSLVCMTENVPQNTAVRDDEWKAFRIQETLAFSLVGILSGISCLMAENGTAIFAISTFNTDYILTKTESYDKALELLSREGSQIVSPKVFNYGRKAEFMKHRKEILDFGMTFSDVYMDAPFHDDNWILLRYRKNKKAFAWTYERDGYIWVNVKVNPEWRDFWRNTYPSVLPGYHQNKEHWNSIRLDGTIPDEDIKRMVAESYDLIAGNK